MELADYLYSMDGLFANWQLGIVGVLFTAALAVIFRKFSKMLSGKKSAGCDKCIDNKRQ